MDGVDATRNGYLGGMEDGVGCIRRESKPFLRRAAVSSSL